MERQRQRDLEILTAIAEGRPLTQRALAERLRVALGLTNLMLRRLAKKGYIKIVEFPRKEAARDRLRYLLTPKGITEKTRLAYEYMGRSLTLYRVARETLRGALGPVAANGVKRIALYGAGEAAELAYLTLKELGLEPVAVFALTGPGTFLGMPVRDVREMRPDEFDVLILATFDKPKVHVPRLVALGVPAEKILTFTPTRVTSGPR